MISQVADVARLGTILGIWAHPDDETYTMAGIMMTAVKNGQTVACITATRGEAGVQDATRWPPEKLADIRSAELDAAYKIMGITHHHWLDYPDGGCKKMVTAEAVARLKTLISHYKPDSILTFGSDGMTGHDDHKTVSDWSRRAVKASGSAAKIYHAIQTREQYQHMLEADKKFNIFFNIDKPPVCEENQCTVHFVLPDDLYDLKLAALKSMPSQTEGMLNMFADSLRTSIGTEAFIQAKV